MHRSHKVYCFLREMCDQLIHLKHGWILLSFVLRSYLSQVWISNSCILIYSEIHSLFLVIRKERKEKEKYCPEKEHIAAWYHLVRWNSETLATWTKSVAVTMKFIRRTKGAILQRSLSPDDSSEPQSDREAVSFL